MKGIRFIVLPILIFLLGLGLGNWYKHIESPSTVAILESGNWHEKDVHGDGEAFLTFSDGNMDIRYRDDDGKEEKLTIPYRQTDHGTLLFERKVLRQLDSSAYFWTLPEGAVTMELVILHSDDRKGSPDSIHVGWKFYSSRDYLITLYNSKTWLKSIDKK